MDLDFSALRHKHLSLLHPHAQTCLPPHLREDFWQRSWQGGAALTAANNTWETRLERDTTTCDCTCMTPGLCGCCNTASASLRTTVVPETWNVKKTKDTFSTWGCVGFFAQSVDGNEGVGRRMSNPTDYYCSDDIWVTRQERWLVSAAGRPQAGTTCLWLMSLVSWYINQ